MGWGWLVTNIRLAWSPTKTKKEFSEKVGVHETTVSEWERDEQAPKYENFEKMLALIGLRMNQVFALPARRKHHDELHRLLDRLMADAKFAESAEHYIRFLISQQDANREAG